MAVLSAVATWLGCSNTAPAEFIPLGFYGRRLWVMVAAAQLVTSIVANLMRDGSLAIPQRRQRR